MGKKTLLILTTPDTKSYEIDLKMYAQACKLKKDQIVIFNPILDDTSHLDLTQYKNIIIAGSRFCLSTEYDNEAIKYLSRLIEKVSKTNIPMMGVCFGAQIIAYSFGAKVQRHNSDQGFVHQEIFVKNHLDTFFEFLTPSIKVNLAHKEAIYDLPSDFVCIASSHYIPNQIIAHKNKNIFGLQFHPEMSIQKARQVSKILPLTEELKNLWLQNIIEHKNDLVSEILPRFVRL